MNVSRSTIRVLAEARGWDQASLSRKAGLSRPYISQILSGERSPSPVALQAIADALDVPLSRLAMSEVVCPKCGEHIAV